MVEITVEWLEKVKKAVDDGLKCLTQPLSSGFYVTPKAVEWLKENHYKIIVVESFGPTGITLMVSPV